MTPGIAVFLIGLLIVPIILLAWGHRIRRASERSQRAFWGAIVGHCVAGVAATIVGVMSPVEWSDTDRLRGFLGLWSLAVLPAAGALIAAAFSRTTR
ncbi:MAG: hypothetical protein FJ202_04905 [Gemmatimonadetes bacterium]|nr:hypothetical protein [Gemmatimonadota bacterium]